ncbi:MAG: TonB-dependent receptor [Bacteroidetes bacterium]|uniref:TonB-dependent receptor n=1 Tax=Candidatus Cryptobacteroides faecavium TaxID=2840762 RepID=A0A9D9IF63_9BACT|nr:TonB-dependent receptor [Candidatus Cryptobacteroides faecavium]
MRKILTAALLLLGITAFAQQHSVKGTVTDQNGYPVIGMAVQEQGTSNGVVTDENGEYSITVASPQASLEFNSLGYETVIEQVNGRAVIDVVSSESAIALDAVVAIGYGSVKKQDLTTAVSVVSNEDMKLRPVSDASGFIQGKVAGVQVQQTSGLPGGGMTVRIRGASSIASSNDPLYVVDGVPVGEGNSAIAYLSPNDIESMSILKDASSAAIYGSRAANGVVLITTKQGKVSQGPQINFSAYVGLSNVTKTYDVLNVAQYKDLMDEIGGATLPDGLRDETDWFDETYSTGITQNYQISVSNGNEKLRYYIGGGYTDEKGVIDVAYNRRYNIKASVDSDLFKWISVGANVAYSSYKSNGIISGTGSNRAGVVLSVVNTPTYAKIWSDENPDWYWNTFYGANLTTPAENMARTENNYSQTDRLLLTGYATIKFHKNLNFKSTVTMDRRWVHDYSFLDPIHTSYGRTQHGEASSTRSDDMRMVYDNILTYNNTWNGVHNFEAMGGTSATTSRWENLSGSRNYFSPDYNNVIWGLNGGNKGGLRGQSQGYAKWAIMSYLARVSYNYDSRYYITANFRADGSSKLAPGHRWGFFPSVSAAWRISGESWMKDISWISDLKLRAGWGQSGNQAGLADYAWVQTYNTNYYDWTSTGYEEAVPTLGSKSNIGNKDLTWETTTQTNVGIDFAILDNRLTFTLDGYYKYTKDLLMSVPLPSPYPSIYRNEGEMSNWGLEFALSSVNLDRKGVRWTTDFNISMNRNRLEKLDLQQIYYYTQTSEALSEYVVRMTPGQPLSMFWGYKAEGVDPETGMMRYQDLNGDGKINSSDKQYIGNANPWFTFGMTNTISWKGLSLSFLITSSIGNDIYNASRIEMVGMYNGANQITDVLRRWKVPGQITDIPKAGELDNLRASTRWVEDGSYLKIKNITLSYDIVHPKLKKANIARIQPYITLDNMITFTNYSGYDPEMSQYTSATSMGIDWGTYPNVKTVTFGVNIDF